VRRWRVAGLTDLGVEPEVADQLAAVGEAVAVADRRQKGDSRDQVHAESSPVSSPPTELRDRFDEVPRRIDGKLRLPAGWSRRRYR
jgi:hypothetical protein